MFVGVAESEVDDLDVLAAIKEQVFGLQVSMCDPQPVDVLDARDQLLKISTGLAFRQPLLRHNVFIQLLSSHILRNQKHLAIRLYYLHGLKEDGGTS